MSPFNIHVDRSLCYTRDGWAERNEVYVCLFENLISDGMLAHLAGNELKVFLCLALQATILTPGPFYESLKGRGLVTDADLNRVICYQSQGVLARQTGLNADTVAAQLDTLERTHRLIAKRMVREGGRFSRPLFLIQGDALLSTPHRRPRAPEGPEPGNGHRSEEFRTVGRRSESTGPVGPVEGIVVVDQPERQGQQQQQQQQLGQPGLDAFRAAFDVFATATGRPYRPSPRDEAGLAELIAQGYGLAQIEAGVQRSVAEARERGKTVRTFAYCLPAIQDRPPSTVSDTACIPPEMPRELRDELALIGLVGADAMHEAAYAWAQDPERIKGWIQYSQEHRLGGGFIRKQIRSGAPAPLQRIERARTMEETRRKRGICPTCYLYFGDDQLCSECGRCYSCCECEIEED